jgi:hypothetical protein
VNWPWKRAIRLKVLRIQPGDVVVLETERLMTAEHVARLRDHLRQIRSLEGVECLVLDGVKVKTILRRSA